MLGGKAENLEKLGGQKECRGKVKTRTLQKPEACGTPTLLER
jgi:hypothetical protein